jgi:hypothetical protein
MKHSRIPYSCQVGVQWTFSTMIERQSHAGLNVLIIYYVLCINSVITLVYLSVDIDIIILIVVLAKESELSMFLSCIYLNCFKI